MADSQLARAEYLFLTLKYSSGELQRTLKRKSSCHRSLDSARFRAQRPVNCPVGKQLTASSAGIKFAASEEDGLRGSSPDMPRRSRSSCSI